ncbi:Deoxyuridine 5'-triphosphate nucleotidohydrolase [Sebaldella termitidis]|jgi:dUTP pyrophosphatase|uniref:Deoxyuridine 5'-triphosphate nucleotidohydrolase n=1 Tax=Sebaldella termitidis (strain ATCC 33386 / NCTC 11300) TaxID=526218 RepID=D1AMK2_SEBTE|nr:dUTP diphosphatase [Sebaldella termitidis]ACZ09576.1 deoxyuridine 5'-triphosphate nucleotidohydrolase Dut [Sebaldella termitidis ATCC 33386]SUI24906.1 Deoxyuridine 5'-triphosphate nucleotidohydrolase [Sebaldella termitidis]
MEKIKVGITVENNVEIPKYMTEGAAGIDVSANIEKEIELKPLERYLVPTGIKLEIPEGFEIQVRPRSGLAFKHGITVLNTPGTIDSDYRGEVKVLLINLSNEIYKIQPNERIGQLILGKVYKLDFDVKDGLSETKRGDGGFGHTGK